MVLVFFAVMSQAHDVAWGMRAKHTCNIHNDVMDVGTQLSGNCTTRKHNCNMRNSGWVTCPKRVNSCNIGLDVSMSKKMPKDRRATWDLRATSRKSDVAALFWPGDVVRLLDDVKKYSGDVETGC